MRRNDVHAFVMPTGIVHVHTNYNHYHHRNPALKCRPWTFTSSFIPRLSFNSGRKWHNITTGWLGYIDTGDRNQQPIAQLGSPSTQIGRPKTSIKKDIGRVTQQPEQPEADAEKGSAKARPRRKTQADEVPLYKVILLGDETYVEAHVVTQIQKTVQLDKGEATRIFREAQSSGSSIICVVCEEHAEFYAQQLRRQDIFVLVEKDE